ncbi:hypothetical protein G6656_02165 [Polynucleobacter paneuropaeus]|nr:hypothetical protein [Polynucleobacter paneuropaeus]
MKHINKILILILLGLASHFATAQTGGGTVLVVVNGAKITSGQLNDWVNVAVSEGAKDSPELRQSIMNDLILREAVSQDAKKTGLLTSGNNAFKLKLAEQNAVLELWFAQYFKAHPLSEADVKADYDKQVALSKEPQNAKEYKLSQIVVSSESEANQIIAQLNKGTSFATLAQEKSLDKNSGSRGGIMGWVLPSQLVPPINDVVLNMTKGQFTLKPIQTSNGWHIVMVDDVKPFVLPSFDESKAGIAQALVQQRRQEAVSALMKTIKISQPGK